MHKIEIPLPETIDYEARDGASATLDMAALLAADHAQEVLARAAEFGLRMAIRNAGSDAPKMAMAAATGREPKDISASELREWSVDNWPQVRDMRAALMQKKAQALVESGWTVQREGGTELSPLEIEIANLVLTKKPEGLPSVKGVPTAQRRKMALDWLESQPAEARERWQRAAQRRIEALEDLTGLA